VQFKSDKDLYFTSNEDLLRGRNAFDVEAIFTGISVLTSRPTDNVYPSPPVGNVPATFLSAELFRRLRENPKAPNWASRTHFSDTFPSPILLDTETLFGRDFDNESAGRCELRLLSPGSSRRSYPLESVAAERGRAQSSNCNRDGTSVAHMCEVAARVANTTLPGHTQHGWDSLRRDVFFCSERAGQ